MKLSTVQDLEVSGSESGEKAKPGQGAAKLREEVNRVLSRDSSELAEALSKSAQDGKIQSARFMYKLSEKEAATDEQDGQGKIRSVVQELTDAPPWTGPLPSEMDDLADDDVVD
jgi:hypothetical protein